MSKNTSPVWEKRQLRLPRGQMSPKGSQSESRGSLERRARSQPFCGQRMGMSYSLSIVLFELGSRACRQSHGGKRLNPAISQCQEESEMMGGW